MSFTYLPLSKLLAKAKLREGVARKFDCDGNKPRRTGYIYFGLATLLHFGQLLRVAAITSLLLLSLRRLLCAKYYVWYHTAVVSVVIVIVTLITLVIAVARRRR